MLGLSLAMTLGNPVLGGGGIPFSQILALNPEVAFSAAQTGSCFQERTGASATTPSAADEAVGSLKNWGTKGGFVVAPSDAARPILRASGGLRYLEGDGSDDVLTGALSALRAVAGWTIITGIRNTGSTAASRNIVFITTASANTRAGMFFASGSGVATVAGRRAAADSAATAAGAAHASTDYVAGGIGDYTNTDAFVRANLVQEGQNTSWLTAGVTDNDAGSVQLFAGAGPSGFLAGRLYSLLVFPSVLSAANLAVAERWTAQQMGLSI